MKKTFIFVLIIILALSLFCCIAVGCKKNKDDNCAKLKDYTPYYPLFAEASALATATRLVYFEEQKDKTYEQYYEQNKELYLSQINDNANGYKDGVVAYVDGLLELSFSEEEIKSYFSYFECINSFTIATLEETKIKQVKFTDFLVTEKGFNALKNLFFGLTEGYSLEKSAKYLSYFSKVMNEAFQEMPYGGNSDSFSIISLLLSNKNSKNSKEFRNKINSIEENDELLSVFDKQRITDVFKSVDLKTAEELLTLADTFSKALSDVEYNEYSLLASIITDIVNIKDVSTLAMLDKKYSINELSDSFNLLGNKIFTLSDAVISCASNLLYNQDLFDYILNASDKENMNFTFYSGAAVVPVFKHFGKLLTGLNEAKTGELFSCLREAVTVTEQTPEGNPLPLAVFIADMQKEVSTAMSESDGYLFDIALDTLLSDVFNRVITSEELNEQVGYLSSLYGKILNEEDKSKALELLSTYKTIRQRIVNYDDKVGFIVKNAQNEFLRYSLNHESYLSANETPYRFIKVNSSTSELLNMLEQELNVFSCTASDDERIELKAEMLSNYALDKIGWQDLTVTYEGRSITLKRLFYVYDELNFEIDGLFLTTSAKGLTVAGETTLTHHQIPNIYLIEKGSRIRFEIAPQLISVHYVPNSTQSAGQATAFALLNLTYIKAVLPVKVQVYDSSKAPNVEAKLQDFPSIRKKGQKGGYGELQLTTAAGEIKKIALSSDSFKNVDFSKAGIYSYSIACEGLADIKGTVTVLDDYSSLAVTSVDNSSVLYVKYSSDANAACGVLPCRINENGEEKSIDVLISFDMVTGLDPSKLNERQNVQIKLADYTESLTVVLYSEEQGKQIADYVLEMRDHFPLAYADTLGIIKVTYSTGDYEEITIVSSMLSGVDFSTCGKYNAKIKASNLELIKEIVIYDSNKITLESYEENALDNNRFFTLEKAGDEKTPWGNFSINYSDGSVKNYEILLRDFADVKFDEVGVYEGKLIANDEISALDFSTEIIIYDEKKPYVYDSKLLSVNATVLKDTPETELCLGEVILTYAPFEQPTLYALTSSDFVLSGYLPSQIGEQRVILTRDNFSIEINVFVSESDEQTYFFLDDSFNYAVQKDSTNFGYLTANGQQVPIIESMLNGLDNSVTGCYDSVFVTYMGYTVRLNKPVYVYSAGENPIIDVIYDNSPLFVKQNDYKTELISVLTKHLNGYSEKISLTAKMLKIDASVVGVTNAHYQLSNGYELTFTVYVYSPDDVKLIGVENLSGTFYYDLKAEDKYLTSAVFSYNDGTKERKTITVDMLKADVTQQAGATETYIDFSDNVTVALTVVSFDSSADTLDKVSFNLMSEVNYVGDETYFGYLEISYLSGAYLQRDISVAMLSGLNTDKKNVKQDVVIKYREFTENANVIVR